MVKAAETFRSEDGLLDCSTCQREATYRELVMVFVLRVFTPGLLVISCWCTVQTF